MGQVTIAVGGRHYSLVCGDGEEPQLQRLAAYVDEKAETLSASLGRLSEPRLLLMASLLITDELMDLKAQLAAAQSGGASAGSGAPAPDTREAEQKLTRLAERLESLAFSLEPAAENS
ncbi:cell division protein ZapA [Pedomonas sp. V897]|uniref:cell division protein ZapA n=1 Tax=Pedomonas sp. V897 TaxID=3446482 RepID=UPI003EDF960C